MAFRKPFGISVSNLKARLRDEPCGAFAFYGPEELLKQFYLQKFVALIEKEGMAEFNLVRLDFEREHSLSDLYDECNILPFGGEKRLVICRGLNPAKLSVSDTKFLDEIVSAVPEYLILIFYLEEEEFAADKKTVEKAAVKNLAEKIAFVSFALQDAKVLLPWSRKILANDGLDATDRALQTLFRLSGNRMNIIRAELEKLAGYALAQSRKEVTEEDVLLFARDTAELTAFNLCDAVLAGSTPSVTRILANLKEQEAEPIIIAATLAKTLTNALLMVEGADAETCAKATKLLPWQYERYQRSLFGKKKETLEKCLYLCLDLDRKLKGERSDPFLVMEFAVMEMTKLLGDMR